MATKYELEKFNGNNFLLRKLKMKTILRKYNYLAAIEEKPVHGHHKSKVKGNE